jgi:uncharacterized protein (TIGR00251 family)
MTVIAVKVVPRAANNEIVGWLDGTLKVRVQAPPEDGRANRALEILLAEALGLKKNAVTITSGRSSAHKRVEVAGLARDEIVRRLGGARAAIRCIGAQERGSEASRSFRCGAPELSNASEAA